MKDYSKLYGNPKILVVEDDETQLDLLTEMIREEGVDVVACSCGVQAMQRLNTREFDVAVVDLNLPDLKAEQFLEALIPFAETTSIIINTGFASYESARDALNIGIFAYVEKASDPNELLRHIHRACHARLRRYSQDLEKAVEERTKALRQANKKIKQSEENYRSIFETAASLITSVNIDGNIVDCNSRIESTLGYTKKEILGQSMASIFHLDDLARAQAALAMVLTQGCSHNQEYRMIRKDGRIIHVNISSSVFQGKPDTPLRTICIVDDITERKQSEARVLKYQAKLRSLASELTLTEERLRRNIATQLHDTVSQSLAMAKMQVASLREQIKDMHVHDALCSVHDSLDRVLLDSRTLTAQLCFPTLDILGFEKAVKNHLEEEIQNRCGLLTVFQTDGLPKPLDQDVRAVLFRGVREILTNIGKHAQAKAVEVSLQRQDNQIVVAVKDNGRGCDLTRTQTQGSGFGILSIDEALNRLGGQLILDSTPGAGYKATMIAPLKAEASPQVLKR
jgi:PAS domain S-box-containing protein